MAIRSLGICASVVAFAADQASKAFVLVNAETLAAGVNVAPSFNLVFHRNTGVTFGLLQGTPWWALAIVATAVVLFLAISLVRATAISEAVAYGVVIGGALGNILDRIRFGGVTDFLDFYIGTTHWPAFNLADVFVVCGVGLLLITAGREHAAIKKAPE
jgi:signal peptidase II